MLLERDFAADTLHQLRADVLACVQAAGFGQGLAVEAMLTVHELAANTVRHGAGQGSVRVWAERGGLYCQVRDSGPRGCDRRPRTAWPVQRGHGLWLVREAAGQVSISTGPHGSEVTAVFGSDGTSASASPGTSASASPGTSASASPGSASDAPDGPLAPAV